VGIRFLIVVDDANRAIPALAEAGKQPKPHIKPDQGDLDTVAGKKTLIISGWLGEDKVLANPCG
jgi:hypothetical protein